MTGANTSNLQAGSSTLQKRGCRILCDFQRVRSLTLNFFSLALATNVVHAPRRHPGRSEPTPFPQLRSCEVVGLRSGGISLQSIAQATSVNHWILAITPTVHSTHRPSTRSSRSCFSKQLRHKHPSTSPAGTTGIGPCGNSAHQHPPSGLQLIAASHRAHRVSMAIVIIRHPRVIATKCAKLSQCQPATPVLNGSRAFVRSSMRAWPRLPSDRTDRFLQESVSLSLGSFPSRALSQLDPSGILRELD
jgi:hypothetical protein